MWLTYLLLFFDVILAASGQLLLKKGLAIIGPLEFGWKNIFFLFSNIFKNVYIIIALICYGFAFLFWLFVLSKLKLSLAYPSTALLYVFIILGSWLILKEEISFIQIVGIFIIFIGLTLLLKSAA